MQEKRSLTGVKFDLGSKMCGHPYLAVLCHFEKQLESEETTSMGYLMDDIDI